MVDHIELTLLRKFIERQVAGIPHNPYLRKLSNNHYKCVTALPLSPTASESPEPSDDSVLDGASSDGSWDTNRRRQSSFFPQHIFC
jgi:hypothetical protein